MTKKTPITVARGDGIGQRNFASHNNSLTRCAHYRIACDARQLRSGSAAQRGRTFGQQQHAGGGNRNGEASESACAGVHGQPA